MLTCRVANCPIPDCIPGILYFSLLMFPNHVTHDVFIGKIPGRLSLIVTQQLALVLKTR